MSPRRSGAGAADEAAGGIIAKAARSLMRRARRSTRRATDATPRTQRIPQGLTEREWRRFARGARQLQREAGLPRGELGVHGSRARGTARNDSDIDVALRVDDRTFHELAQRALARTHEPSRLRRSMLRRIRNNGQLSSFDLGTEFTNRRQDLMDRHVQVPVQFSVLRRGGPFDNGPYIPLN